MTNPPREPLEAMIDAARKYTFGAQGDLLIKIWIAMWDAWAAQAAPTHDWNKTAAEIDANLAKIAAWMPTHDTPASDALTDEDMREIKRLSDQWGSADNSMWTFEATREGYRAGLAAGAARAPRVSDAALLVQVAQLEAKVARWRDYCRLAGVRLPW